MELREWLAIAMFASFIVLIFTGFPVAWVLGGLAVLFTALAIIAERDLGIFTSVDWSYASLVVDRRSELDRLERPAHQVGPVGIGLAKVDVPVVLHQANGGREFAVPIAGTRRASISISISISISERNSTRLNSRHRSESRMTSSE